VSADRLPPAVAEAIQWLARSRSGEMNEAEQRRFEQWLHADAGNRQAWEHLGERLDRTFGALPGPAPVSRQTLSRGGSTRRRLLRGALCVAGVGAGASWLRQQGLLGGDMLRSGKGERPSFTLADGSRLMLNAQSRVELDFTPSRRTLVLHDGALDIQVAPDALRPLVVATRFGEARALGTRFMVSLREHEARVWVEESRVAVEGLDRARLELGAGEGARLDAAGLRRLDPRQHGAEAWRDGLLQVHDATLGDVVDALRPYRRGFISVDADALALRISGVFPLDDSEQALISLQEALPIEVESHFGWWTRLRLR